MAVAIILDILVCAVLVFGLIAGLRVGLVDFCFRKFRKLSAAIGACLLAKPVGWLLTDLFFSDLFTGWIMSWAKIEDTVAGSPEEMLAELPKLVRWVAEKFDIDVADLANRAYESGEGMYHLFIKEASLPLARFITVILAGIALFFLLRFLLMILSPMFAGIVELPVVKQLNILLGGAVSLLLYAAFVWVGLKVLVWIAGFETVANWGFMQGFSIEKTYVSKFIYAFEPLSFLLSIK